MTAWVIQRPMDGHSFYLRTDEFGFAWTDDLEECIWFCRQSDAAQIASVLDDQRLQILEVAIPSLPVQSSSRVQL